MFSLRPNDYKGLHKNYCKSKTCQQQAVVDKLKKDPNDR